MKRSAALILTACLIAACNGERDDVPVTPASEVAVQPTQGPIPAAQQPAKAKPVPAPEGQKGADMLTAAGVILPFPHGVLYDILDTSSAGTPRHRVLYEVRTTAFPEAVKEVGNTLASRGYRKVDDRKDGDRIQQVFQADGKPTYYLILQPAGMGPKLTDPAATGSIHVMWNIP